MKSLIDVRVKLIITVVTIFFIVSVSKPGYLILCSYFILCTIIVIIFKPDFVEFIKRLFKLYLVPLLLSIFIPFASKGNILYELRLSIIKIQITDNGISTFYSVLIKSFLSLFLLCALIVSTDEREILWGLRKLYVPRIFVSIIFLMYRYFFLFKDELVAGKRAINSRVFKKSGFAINKKTAYLLGSLFIRTFTRAENIYLAMQSRGFNGNFHIISDDQRINKVSIFTIASLLFLNISIRTIGFFNLFSSGKIM
ncbi:MAG: cobalt ECF transporter T component CbiQ [Actinomycetota bacterium]|nr:cobalt ECF transporter T component CbiQ [Actinomycetota bacterium]